MAKPLNAKRRLHALLTSAPKGSNPAARAMIIQKRGGRHTDRSKEAARKACRGGASWD